MTRFLRRDPDILDETLRQPNERRIGVEPDFDGSVMRISGFKDSCTTRTQVFEARISLRAEGVDLGPVWVVVEGAED